MAFDRKIFSASDAFHAEQWRACTAYWLLVQGRKVGCCAFEENVNFTDDRSKARTNRAVKGCLYIATTGLLKEHRGQGLGSLMKAWQIAYAKRHGFKRIVTNTRESNAAMIQLNEKFGFHRLRVTQSYYSDPEEATVVMELRL